MPSSSPVLFERYKNRSDLSAFTIISITDGVTTWLLGNVSLNLTDGCVYDVGVKWTGGDKKIIYPALTTTIIGGSVKLVNLPFKNDTSGQRVQLSELINDIINKTITIYIGVGPVKSLSDCKPIFIGKVKERPSFDNKSITIKVRDASFDIHRIIPTTTVSEHSATNSYDYLDEYKDNYIPLNWGVWSLDDFHDGSGPAPTTRINDELIAAAIHKLNATSTLWMRSPAIDYQKHGSVEIIGPTFNDALGTATYPNILNTYCYFRPNSLIPRKYEDSLYPNAADNPFFAVDRTSGSFATIKGAATAEAEEMAAAHWFLGFDYNIDTTSSNVTNGVGIIDPSDGINLQVIGKLWPGTTTKPFLVYYIDPDNGQRSTKIFNMGTFNGTLQTRGPANTVRNEWLNAPPDEPDVNKHPGTGIFWHFEKGQWNLDCPIGFSLGAYKSGRVDEEVIRLNEFRLRVTARLFDKGDGLVECEGREFGPWIAGRPTNGVQDGNTISGSAYIIESIYRDVLALNGSQIDTASFDAAHSGYNKDVISRLSVNNLNRTSSQDFVQQLSSQSTFVSYYSPEDKLRLIRLDDKAPSTDVTVQYCDVVGKASVSYTTSNQIRNNANVECNYRYDRDSTDSFITSNSGSIDTYGQWDVDINWPWLDKSSAEFLADFLYGDSDAILANDHLMIKFKTNGIKYINTTLGDTVELDATSWDASPYKYPNGGSWSGKKLRVFGIKPNQDKVDITLLELY